MKNPFSYRNRLANRLHSERKQIDAGVSQSTREELYNALSEERTSKQYNQALYQARTQANDRRFKVREKKEKLFREYEFDFSGLGPKHLTEEIARDIVQKAEGKQIISLPRVEELTPYTAAILAEFDGELIFGGLRGLDTKTVKNLISHKGGLIFPKIHTLDAEQAELFAQSESSLSFHELKELSAEVAEKFLNYQGPRLYLHVEKLSRSTAKILAQCKNLHITPESSMAMVAQMRRQQVQKSDF